jgi:hypothetical protein
MDIETKTINNIHYIYKGNECYWFIEGTGILNKGGPGSGRKPEGNGNDIEVPELLSNIDLNELERADIEHNIK